MENKALNDNIGAIRRYDSLLCDNILMIQEFKSSFELRQNQNETHNLIYNNVALHSFDDPILEAKKIVDSIEGLDEKNSVRVVYGVGLGYLADEFINRSAGTVVIYEPEIEILRAFLELVEFSSQLQKPNVYVCSTITSLQKWIDLSSDKNTKITFSFLTSYKNIFNNHIYSVAKKTEMIRGEKQTNKNTLETYANLSVTNTLCNLDVILNSPTINSLEGIYKGKSVIIASAGPSLHKNIEVIKKHRDKFVLFAVGPALKLLQENGITPDFLFIVEINDTQGQIDNCDLANINLISEPFTNPYLNNLKFKNRFLFFSKNNFLNDALARELGINIRQNETIGTVSYCALSSAKIMGFEKIILIGQDLAYSDGKCYSKGSVYEDLECILNIESGKYEIVAKDIDSYKKGLIGSRDLSDEDADKIAQYHIKHLNSMLYTTQGQDGKPLPTQAGYALFVKHFERFAFLNPKLEFINSSTGGAQINGYKNIDLEDAIKNNLAFSNIELQYIVPNYDILKIKNFFKKYLNEFLKMIEICEKINTNAKLILKEVDRRNVLNKNTDDLVSKNLENVNILEKNSRINSFLQVNFAGIISKTRFYYERIKAKKNPEELVAAVKGNHHFISEALYNLKIQEKILSDI